MSKIIYIVTEGGGRYDDERWEINRIATSDQKDAEQFVEYAKLANEITAQIISSTETILIACRKNAGPLPEYKQEIVPKWGSGVRKQDITPEMRSERDRILGRNKVASDAYIAEHREREVLIRSMVLGELKSLGYSATVAEFFVEQAYYSGSRYADSHFDINEIQLI